MRTQRLFRDMRFTGLEPHTGDPRRRILAGILALLGISAAFLAVAFLAGRF